MRPTASRAVCLNRISMNYIKKRWRDGADLTEEIRDEIADIRVYLELLAKCFGVEGAKLDARVEAKLLKVVEKHKGRLT